MERVSIREYVRMKDSPLRGDVHQAAITCLLTEGWVQYLASPDGHIFFRRLVQ